MADEAPTTPAAPAPEPAAPALQSSPWQHDIEAQFAGDVATQVKVDQFLRQRVQPRVTQLEQQVSEAADAVQLWEAFNEDPVGTYESVKGQLMEAGMLEEQAGAAAAEAIDQAGDVPAQGDPRLDWLIEREQAREAAEQEAQNDASYQNDVQALLADPSNADLDPDLIHEYIYMADGDFDKGVELFRASQAKWAAKFGGEAPPPGAPPVVGSDTPGSGPVPTQPDLHGKEGLDRAIERATEAMLRTPAPPVS